MRRFIALLTLLFFSPLGCAEEIISKLVLDKILFQVSAKQWVTTQTVLLSVSINVTLNSADLVKARADIMERLTKIAQGDWHFLEFNRSQDSSGLEKLYVHAQARVTQAALTAIYQNAKSVSIPGAQYEISGVEFKPSLEEVQKVRTTIRQQLYQQVQDEITRINKVYPTQNYSVSHLVFVDGDSLSQSYTHLAKGMTTMAAAPAALTAAPLSVSNELVMTAVVQAASNRKEN